MHYRIFDLWRFVAAILIMLYHFLYFAPYELWALFGPIAQRPTGLLDLFFMVSGFLVMMRYGPALNGPADYLLLLRRRLAALYPLHLLTLLFFVPVALAGALGWIGFHNDARWDLASLPMHLLLLHAWGTTPELGFNLPSWSVSAEFFCYLLFPVIVLSFRRWGLRGLCVLLLCWLVLIETLWSAGLLGDRHWSRANLFGAYRAFLSFGIGCLVALVQERVAPRIAGGMWIAQGLVVAAVALMLVHAQPLLPLALLAGALLCAASAETADPRSTEGLERYRALTQTSFGIYLWHMVLAAICYQLLWKALLPGGGPGAFLVFSLLPIAGTLAAAWLSQPFQTYAYKALSGARRDPGDAPAAAMNAAEKA